MKIIIKLILRKNKKNLRYEKWSIFKEKNSKTLLKNPKRKTTKSPKRTTIVNFLRNKNFWVLWIFFKL